MVTGDDPAVKGVPANTPAAVSVRPFGNTPLVTPKLYGAVPPLPVIVCAYATPTVPLGNVAGKSVMVGHTGGTGGAAAMTIVYATYWKHPFASVPRIVTGDDPAVVG